MDSLKQLLSKVKPVLWLIVASGTLFLLFIAYWILDKLLAYRLADSYVSRIADAFDINRNFAEAMTIVLAVVLAVCTGLVFSFSKQRRLVGIGGLLALLVINSLVLWYATSGQYVDRTGRALKCYFFVGDQIQYGVRPGFDPVTGRECREITPDILQRLSDYQAGLKPTEIVQSDVIFFDPRSGEPRVWYVRTKDGRLRLFNLRGFDPETGTALLPATRVVAAEWPVQHAAEKKAAAKDLAPNRVDTRNIQFFNPRSGAPAVWYWRSMEGDFEFFDNEGFHPQTGDKLLPVSKQIVSEFNKRRTEIEKRVKEEEAQRAADAALKAQQEADRQAKIEHDRKIEEDKRAADAALKAKQEADRQAQIERDRKIEEDKRVADAARRAAERQELSQAADNCDQYAANPYDPRKPPNIPGAPYERVQSFAAQAAEFCEKARRLFPDDPRYKYQAARAYQVFDPKKALSFYRELTQATPNYPAAYDNLGWLYIDGRAGEASATIAVRHFRAGALLGDPDAMVSLAKMYTSGLGGLPQSADAAYEWYEKAAARGHRDAVAFVDKVRSDKQTQQQTKEFMLEVMKGLLNKIPVQQ